MGIFYIFAKRFIAGESIGEALQKAKEMNGRGFLITLDYLGENTRTVEDADRASSVYVELLERIKVNGIGSNVSLKLTQFGLDLGRDVAKRNLLKVINKAAETENFVRIDMEGSAYTDATLDLFYEIFEEHGNVGVVIQSCLKRSMDDIKRLVEKGARVRLCKGAYKEPPRIAFRDKKDTDRNFVRLMKVLLKDGVYPGIATHDAKIIEETGRFASENSIEKGRFEFQMLFGIRPKLQLSLLEEGYPVRIYMPFGSHWLPYTLRRLRERRENLYFFLKNLFRG